MGRTAGRTGMIGGPWFAEDDLETRTEKPEGRLDQAGR